MNNKQGRLQEVYEYVRAHCGVHTKTEFAIRLHMTQPALSAAMNGKEAYLTQNLFQKICAAFPGIFNLDYLLTGQGELLLASDSPEPSTTKDSASVDVDFYHKALENDANVIAALRRDIEYYQQMVLDKDATIQEHNEHIVALQIENTRLTTNLEHNKTTLAAVRKNYDAKLDELAQRDQMIKMLESIVESNRNSSGKHSDFPGVADGDTHPLYATDDIK